MPKRKQKKKTVLEGTGWLVLLSILLVIILVLAFLEEAGIFKIPTWFGILWLAAVLWTLLKSSSSLSWLYDMIYLKKRK